jgi:iron complex outermembrane recepter protein
MLWRVADSAVTGIAVLALVAAPVRASQLEEVVVTAQKRVESLQDLPVSVGAVSGEMIRNNDMQNMEDLAVRIPNLNVSDKHTMNFGGPTLTVPGIYFGNYECPRRIELSASYGFGK